MAQNEYIWKLSWKIRTTRTCLNSYLLDADVGSIAFEEECCRKTVKQGYHPIIRSLITVEMMILRENDLQKEGVLSHIQVYYCPEQVNLMASAR